MFSSAKNVRNVFVDIDYIAHAHDDIFGKCEFKKQNFFCIFHLSNFIIHFSAIANASSREESDRLRCLNRGRNGSARFIFGDSVSACVRGHQHIHYYRVQGRYAAGELLESPQQVFQAGCFFFFRTPCYSVECYAKLHSYPFHLFSDAKYKECEKHKDASEFSILISRLDVSGKIIFSQLFFRRHCAIVHFMKWEMEEGTWLLVLDGDIAVINPMV